MTETREKKHTIERRNEREEKREKKLLLKNFNVDK